MSTLSASANDLAGVERYTDVDEVLRCWKPATPHVLDSLL